VQPNGYDDYCKGGGLVCPGTGAYCGSDGVQGGDANTLYQCPGSGQAPSSSQPCASGCNVQPAGTPDVCNSSTSGGTTGGTGSGPVCPGNGAYCGSDGVTNGAANTLYQCPAAGQAPSSSTACPSTCTVEPAGTPDYCAGSQIVCPGTGPYCGSDGVTNGAANTLYQCPGVGQAPSSSTACPSTCTVEPAGTPDYCAGSQIICPGMGPYCGSDGVTGGAADTLYQCPGAGLAPGSTTPCGNGCQVEASGTPDYCKGATPICPGVGAFCGSDGVGNGDSNTLYQCPGANQAPTSSQACSSGCQVEPAGTPDYCKNSQPVCPGSGGYCGSDGVTNGQSNTLYQCPGSGQAPSSQSACSNGCQVEPAGTNDYCKAVCPGTGAYCGSDGVTGGSANTLYQCPGAGQAPTSAQACSAGCQVESTGTPDYCKGACGGASGAALSWQAQKIAAGEGGNCGGSPPSCYSDWCLAFVNNAFAAANDPASEHFAPSAAQAAQNAESSGNWTWWNGSCPCGAILFWAGNPCNGGDGHVVICNGDGTASTSGWPGYSGSSHAPIGWLVSMECGHSPAGYAMPQ
ncbi:MAG: hypothetical protein ACYCWW_01420, partial [Deltaproteobacteria bacterium]